MLINRIRFFGDLHAHPFAFGSKLVDGVNSRLQHAVDTLDECLGTLLPEEKAPEVVIFLGDLFHQRGTLPTAAVSRVLSSFAEWRNEHPESTLVAIAGNHDLVGREGESALRILETLPGFDQRIVEETELISLPLGHPTEVEIIAVPYQDTIDDSDYEILRDWVKRTLAYKHEIGEYAGPRPLTIFASHNGIIASGHGLAELYPGEPSWSADELARVLPAGSHCVSGHWHEPWPLTQVKDSQGQSVFFFRPGATHQQSWGDAGGSRGFAELSRTALDGQWSLETHETQSAPRFFDVGPGGFDLTGVRPRFDFVRVNGTKEEAERLVEDGDYNVVGVVPPAAEERKIRIDLSKATSDVAVFQTYAREKHGKSEFADTVVAFGTAILQEIAR